VHPLREPDLAASFDSGLQRARVCRALLGLVDAAERWTPAGPATDARVSPARSQDPDAPRLLAACWALWEGSSTLTLSELLRLSPPRLEAVGELLAALARGPLAVEAWLERFEPVTTPPRSALRSGGPRRTGA